MQHKTKTIILASAGALVALVATAGAATYVTKEVINDEKPAASRSDGVAWNGERQPAQPQRVASACDDNNIIGTVLGGVGGGIIGNQIGSGSGNTVATIGGAVGGAALGNEFIPTDGETCNW